MPENLKRARRVLDIEIEALREVRKRVDSSFSDSIDLLANSASRKRKIILTGVGKSGHIAQKIAATFTSTGAPSVFLDPLNATHGDLGLVSRGDTIIALSYSGETEELCRILPLIKRLTVPIIAITGRPKSTLGQSAVQIINISVKREACPHNLAPTSSTTVMLAIGDALAMALLEARDFSESDFAKYHPGGSIGKHLLMRAGDVMRPITHVATLKGSQSVQDAIQAMARKRCGAAIIVSKSGTLTGIYTHGDFSRSYLQNQQIGSSPLSSVLTKNPVTVNETTLAVEVLNLLEQHQIDDIVVLNSKKRPVGLIDVQDLARLKLI
ncbi:MAG: KpsF/GutQ family sugar-phosphate isomerase [Verrucomicrobiota bacterium]